MKDVHESLNCANQFTGIGLKVTSRSTNEIYVLIDNIQIKNELRLKVCKITSKMKVEI